MSMSHNPRSYEGMLWSLAEGLTALDEVMRLSDLPDLKTAKRLRFQFYGFAKALDVHRTETTGHRTQRSRPMGELADAIRQTEIAVESPEESPDGTWTLRFTPRFLTPSAVAGGRLLTQMLERQRRIEKELGRPLYAPPDAPPKADIPSLSAPFTSHVTPLAHSERPSERPKEFYAVQYPELPADSPSSVTPETESSEPQSASASASAEAAFRALYGIPETEHRAPDSPMRNSVMGPDIAGESPDDK